MPRLVPQNLPCSNCPHDSVCCTYGASVTDAEAVALRAAYSDRALVWSEEEQGWRTSVVDGKCTFMRLNRCRIYGLKGLYPEVCQGFPHTRGLSEEPYGEGAELCPEVKEVT